MNVGNCSDPAGLRIDLGRAALDDRMAEKQKYMEPTSSKSSLHETIPHIGQVAYFSHGDRDPSGDADVLGRPGRAGGRHVALGGGPGRSAGGIYAAAPQGIFPAASGRDGRADRRSAAVESGGFLHGGSGAGDGFNRRPHGDGAGVALRPGGTVRARGADLSAGHRPGREFRLGPRPDRSPVRRGYELPAAAGDCAGHGRRAHGAMRWDCA